MLLYAERYKVKANKLKKTAFESYFCKKISFFEKLSTDVTKD